MNCVSTSVQMLELSKCIMCDNCPPPFFFLKHYLYKKDNLCLTKLNDKTYKEYVKTCTYLCVEFAQIGSDTSSPHSAFILTHALTDSLSSRQIYWALNGRFPPHAAL